MATHITPINPLVCLNQATNKYRTVGKESVTARRLPMELLFNSPVFTTKFCRDRDSNTQVTLLVYVVFFFRMLLAFTMTAVWLGLASIQRQEMHNETIYH